MRTHAEISAATRQSGASPVRIEHDLLGERAVPAAALYGIHTARALANFDITGEMLARYPLLIQAIAAGGGVLELALSKGLLDEVQARQIEDAAIAQVSGDRRQAIRPEVPAR